MVLLKTVTRERGIEDTSLIGFKVKKDLSSFLALFCLAKGITKTSILTKLLKDWSSSEHQKKVTKESLIDSISRRAIDTWVNMPKKNRSFQGFLNSLRVEFHFKGIDDAYIDKILENIRNEKDKEGNALK